MATTITDKAGLQNMDLDLAGDYVLGGNIDASGAAFTPVGDNVSPFTGTLALAGYTITGLNMSIADDYNGLFGYTDGATISNGTLADFDITGEDRTGTLIGAAVDTTISDITVTGAIVVGQDYTGGMAGYLYNCTTTDCSVAGTVTSDPAGSWNYGGYAGYIGGGSVCSRCSADVVVTAIAEHEVGGFVGICNTSTYIQCYALGDVDGADDVGGFVGTVSGNNQTATFTDCYAMGDVHSVDYAGGFVQEEFVGGTGSATFTNCYSMGAVTSDQAPEADYVGGFAQDDNGNTTYTNCFWDVGTSGVALSKGGTGKTTAQMKLISTFPWDIAFSPVDDPTDGYPYLGWQEDIFGSVWYMYGEGTPRRETEEPVSDIVSLEALRNVEMSAQGRVFTDEEGNFVYKSRYARNP